MQETQTGRQLGLGAIGAACLLAAAIPGHAGTATPALALAVTALDYVDTSGEARDQQADHARRLAAFTEALRSDLAANGKFRIVTLDCRTAGCPASATPPEELVAAAGKAGAAYVLVGGIQKMSTLVQWAKVGILDVGRQKMVFERLLTFRGDDDTSWRRTEEFLARDILQDAAFK
jgi:hypothetical protein